MRLGIGKKASEGDYGSRLALSRCYKASVFDARENLEKPPIRESRWRTRVALDARRVSPKLPQTEMANYRGS
jgi:hypothetical protein